VPGPAPAAEAFEDYLEFSFEDYLGDLSYWIELPKAGKGKPTVCYTVEKVKTTRPITFTCTKMRTWNSMITIHELIINNNALYFGSARKWYAKECSSERITWAGALDGKEANVWERCTPGECARLWALWADGPGRLSHGASPRPGVDAAEEPPAPPSAPRPPASSPPSPSSPPPLVSGPGLSPPPPGWPPPDSPPPAAGLVRVLRAPGPPPPPPAGFPPAGQCRLIPPPPGFPMTMMGAVRWRAGDDDADELWYGE